MLRSGLLLSFFCTFLLASASAFPSTENQSSVISDNQIQALADKSQWAHLLHVRLHPFSRKLISQNDSDNFFLAADGKTNPEAEMAADIAAFSLTEQAPDVSAQCQFPARYFWLKQQLPRNTFVDQPCPKFEKWRDDLEANSLTLIFPASHINSPSSMYGHTLVRMDRADPSRSKLLAYSVNFAANADPTDNELVFSYKGLTGGYPGVVSVMPYYEKTNQYQHMEYRDTWEYPLNFTPDEVAQFVRHIWETQDTYFDYFFFDENCSYRLLALLDASSERANLADQFILKAVPVDTIRALEQQNLVAGYEYRPSAATELEFMATQADGEVVDRAKQLVESDDSVDAVLVGLSPLEQAQALELGHAYARYLSVKKKKASPELRKRTIAILSARSKLETGSPFTSVPMPDVRDDQGHKTQRARLTLGQSDEQPFVQLSWRAAYHEILDLPKGFVPGSQIQMGEIDIRDGGNHDLQLQRFLLVDVLSLSHRTRFQRPVAWGVSAGMDRYAAGNSELFTYLNVGFGRAHKLGDGRIYALAQIELKADNQFEDGIQASIGPRLGWLYQGQTYQQQFEFNWQPATLGDDTIRRQLLLQQGVGVADNLQLRLAFKRQWAEAQAINEADISAVWYF